MNKKMIIGAIFIIVVGIAITITSITLVTKSLMKTDIDATPSISEEENKNQDELEGELESKLEEEITDFDNDVTDISYPINSEAKELTEATAKTLEEQARRLYREFKFVEASEFLTDIVNDYKVEDSEYFSNLETLYRESSLMYYLPLVEGDNDQVISIVRSITDVENHMLATLFIDSSLRDYLIHTEDSISPIFYGGVNVKTKRLLSKDDFNYKEAIRDNNDIENMFEFEITVETFAFKAYIVESKKDTYFYKIVEEEENSTPFYTISEWREIDKKFNQKSKKEVEDEEDIQAIEEVLDSENN